MRKSRFDRKPDSGNSRSIWVLHVDPTYKSKASLSHETRTYHRQEINRNLRNDVETVLNGMLFHPRNHSHLEDCGVAVYTPQNYALGVDEINIRVGGGIENPFVFLLHLRYQFCLVSKDIRDQERNRLIDLFVAAIKKKWDKILPAEFFNFKR